jgi:hypothetical protein
VEVALLGRQVQLQAGGGAEPAAPAVWGAGSSCTSFSMVVQGGQGREGNNEYLETDSCFVTVSSLVV